MRVLVRSPSVLLLAISLSANERLGLQIQDQIQSAQALKDQLKNSDSKADSKATKLPSVIKKEDMANMLLSLGFETPEAFEQLLRGIVYID
jgi:hypothetical protein